MKSLNRTHLENALVQAAGREAVLNMLRWSRTHGDRCLSYSPVDGRGTLWMRRDDQTYVIPLPRTRTELDFLLAVAEAIRGSEPDPQGAGDIHTAVRLSFYRLIQNYTDRGLRVLPGMRDLFAPRGGRLPLL